MKIDRKWLVLALLCLPLLVLGCSKKPPTTTPPAPPPQTVETPPATDVDSSARPADAVDDVERRPPQSIQELEEDLRRQGLLGDVFFDFDQYDLRSDARQRLAKNADYMKGPGSDLTFTVEGHCDERGTNEYNLALGQQRSNAAVDYLVSLGVPASRFKTISYGEEKPFCTESTEACWQQNRRARFVVDGRTGG